MPLILSGVCSPSPANYCSNPFEIFFDNLNFPALFLQVPPAVGVVAVDVANALVGVGAVETVI